MVKNTEDSLLFEESDTSCNEHSLCGTPSAFSCKEHHLAFEMCYRHSHVRFDNFFPNSIINSKYVLKTAKMFILFYIEILA